MPLIFFVRLKNLRFKHLALITNLAVCFVLSSCISKYDITPAEFHEAIVVEGMITDGPGPYEIIISKTVPVDQQSIVWASGATVSINDDLGNLEQLEEKSTGHFYTKNFQGTVGRTYSITITAGDGNVYKSTPQKLLPVGDFDLHSSFEQVEDYLANLQVSSKNGFNVYIDSELDTGQQGRVWWRTTATYHVLTYPNMHTKWVGKGSNLVEVPDPLPCSSVDNHPICTCCDCWIIKQNQKPLISDPRFISNNKINNLKIGFVEANRRTLYDKYVLEVQQLSVSEDVYEFWKRVGIQQSNSSYLFQTPVPATRSTFVPQSSSAIPIIGYFAASSIKKKVITFTSSQVPYPIITIDIIPDSCLNAYLYSTNEQPSFW